MRASLASALRNVDKEDNPDAAVLARLQAKQNRKKFGDVTQTTQTVTRVLEEPQLPSRKDLARCGPNRCERR